MAFRARRQARKDRMISEFGMLRFEAHVLSQIPIKVPYLTRLLNERRRLRAQFVKEGRPKAAYEAHIKKLYEDNNWKVTPSAITRTKSKGWHDPWAMLRDKKDEYQRANPDWKSPSDRYPRSRIRGKQRELDEGKLERGRQRARGQQRGLPIGSVRQISPDRFIRVDDAGNRIGELRWNPDTGRWDEV